MSIQKTKNSETSYSKVKNYVSAMKIQCYSSVFLKELTSNFSESSIVGHGGYGVVYRGKLPNGEDVAIKDLGSKDIVEETFMAEVSTMSNTNHKNLIQLKGDCFELNLKALVYEYMEKGSLEKLLYKPDISIKWETLYRIATEIAEGLNYFHFGSTDQIIHYDIKAGNVLLDNNLSPKIIDFGLAKLIKRDVREVPLSRIRGTQGYTAPELYSHGYGSKVTNKCDVYSFGMLLFEILGKRNILERQQGEYFPKQVWNSANSGQLECLFDNVGITKEKDDRENAEILSKVALLCIQDHPDDRPTMKEVWLMLDKEIPILQEPPLPNRLWLSSTSSMTSVNSNLISEDDFNGPYGSNKNSMTSSLTSANSYLISEDDFDGSYGSNNRTMQDGLNDTWKKVTYKDGTCYEGTLKNGLRHGQGKGTYIDGMFVGEWKYNFRGHGRFILKNGDEYIGDYKNDVQEGQGRYVWKNGDEYIGEFKNNLIEGHGKYICKSGEYYEGTFNNNRKDGRGKCVYINGNKYIGEWKNGNQEGHGRYVWENGDEYIGEFKNNLIEGHGKYINEGGDYYEGIFKNDLKNGQGRYVSANGSEYIGEWKNGKQEGQGRFTYKDGAYYEGAFKNNFRNGQGRQVNASGDEYIGEWKNGKQEGHGRCVWANGDEYIGEFKNNLIEGHGKYICKSGDYYDGTFKNNFRDGKGKYVYENGNEYNGEWRKGKLEGQGRFTYEDGAYYDGKFKNDLRDGKGIFVSAKGEESIGLWREGVQQ